ncbi:MAG: hypothetical protein HEP70_19280 [Rhodobiaceae bacterium]|uniref:DUF4177 domain-containing protein n=1 Tax=Phaeobacter piscinae TaxID=1580596 RepID=A0ABM6PK38_9RHOB|nr:MULTISPECIES: hypothetical protein [Rhodobacterales]ATG37965.1 Domain protein of unknown function [Phaeobacter piscinae]AUQ88486.1 Domain protein of unknown function [Phaeobacter piscinae]MCE8000993.1 hypothetical protein [Rhodobiaceae bacterium]
MKQFENEVLTFDASSQAGCAKMEDDLRSLGLVGWEVISVVPRDLGARVLMVFMKREVSEDTTLKEEAA